MKITCFNTSFNRAQQKSKLGYTSFNQFLEEKKKQTDIISIWGTWNTQRTDTLKQT